MTDSRIVFYATSKGRGTQRASSLMQQTKIAEITGMTVYVNRRISLLLVLSAIWFTLFGLSSLLFVPAVGIIWLALAAACVIAIIAGGADRGATGVMIHSRVEGSSAIAFGRWNSSRGWIGAFTHAFTGPLLSIFGVYNVFDVLFGVPGQDSDQVISELGSLITDLQTRGDLAFEYYGIPAGTLGGQQQRGQD